MEKYVGKISEGNLTIIHVKITRFIKPALQQKEVFLDEFHEAFFE